MVLAVIATLLLCAGTAMAEGQRERATATGEMVRSNTLKVDILTGRVGQPGNFNGWAGWIGNDKGWQQLLYESFWTAEYMSGEIINTLAADGPSYNSDFTRMTVPLRRGITWSDGVAFTADDVIHSVMVSRANPGFAYQADMELYVDTVRKTDDYTVVFELKRPNSRFHEIFLDRWGAFRFFPKHVWENVQDPMTFQNENPVGTGPYVLESFDPSGYWFIYRRRDDWQNTSVGQQFGEPAPMFVQFIYYGGADRKVIAQAAHDLDMADLTPESYRATLARNPHATGFFEDFPYAEIWHPCVTGAQFNALVAPYDNKDVRWALNLASDIVEMVMTAYDGSAALSPLYIPATLPFYEWYYDRMQDWLVEEFTIEVGGRPYRPYDPSIPFTLAERAAARGNTVPTDPAEIRQWWGYGWWKYDVDAAAQLLQAHGFRRNAAGRWLKPDGQPWKIDIIAHPNPAHPGNRWAFVLAEQWRRFGIDATAVPMENRQTLTDFGKFDVNTNWPVTEPFGSHSDLYRSFKLYHSRYVRDIDERVVGHGSRWSDPRMDEIIDAIEQIPFDDPRIIDKGIEAAKILIEEQPGISMSSYVGYLGLDTYYWTGYPSSTNAYSQIWYHWPNFQFMLPRLQPTGRN